MRNLLSVLIVVLFFIGCTSKQEVDIKNPSKEVINELGKPINKKVPIGEKIGEEIDPLEESKVIEIEMPTVDNSESMELAFTYSSKVVGKYARTSMNTILAYLTHKNIKYQVKIFDSISETPENIEASFMKIKESGFENVIALYSPKSMETIHNLDTSGLKVYLPLNNKEEILSTNYNFIYGGISYTKQIEKLLDYSNIKNAMFFQKSYLGTKIKTKYEELVSNIVVSKEIKKKRNYFKGLVKDYRLKNSTLFMNTDIVKTSILLSQLRAYEIIPNVILSTQNNYNPKILNLTQVKDRENFIVANSIDIIDEKLEDTISTFGADTKYNWVDYSTLVGINYLYDENESGLLLTLVEDNQVNYEPKLFKTTAFGFLEIK